jgi:hypothetical protein
MARCTSVGSDVRASARVPLACPEGERLEDDLGQRYSFKSASAIAAATRSAAVVSRVRRPRS